MDSTPDKIDLDCRERYLCCEFATDECFAWQQWKINKILLLFPLHHSLLPATYRFLSLSLPLSLVESMYKIAQRYEIIRFATFLKIKRIIACYAIWLLDRDDKFDHFSHLTHHIFYHITCNTTFSCFRVFSLMLGSFFGCIVSEKLPVFCCEFFKTNICH